MQDRERGTAEVGKKKAVACAHQYFQMVKCFIFLNIFA